MDGSMDGRTKWVAESRDLALKKWSSFIGVWLLFLSIAYAVQGQAMALQSQNVIQMANGQQYLVPQGSGLQGNMIQMANGQQFLVPQSNNLQGNTVQSFLLPNGQQIVLPQQNQSMIARQQVWKHDCSVRRICIMFKFCQIIFSIHFLVCLFAIASSCARGSVYIWPSLTLSVCLHINMSVCQSKWSFR